MNNLELSLDDLNKIVEKSFGPAFKCNYNSFSGGRLEECDELNIIGRKAKRFDEQIGWMGDEDHEGPKDGSVITATQVHGIYSGGLKKYADLYEEATGKKVSIRLAVF